MVQSVSENPESGRALQAQALALAVHFSDRVRKLILVAVIGLEFGLSPGLDLVRSRESSTSVAAA